MPRSSQHLASYVSAELTPVGASRALPYTVNTPVGSSRALPYTVIAPVGSSRALPYTIFKALGASRALPYTVSAAVGASRALPYVVNAALGASRALPYAVFAPLGASRALPYAVFAPLGASRTLPYTILAAAGSSRALPYTVIAAVGASRALPYGLAGIVGASRALPYGLAGIVGASRTLPYTILAAAGSSRVLPYTVNAEVGSSRALPYAITGAVGASRALPYSVFTPVGSSRALPYTVRALAGSSRALPYSVLAVLGATRALPYAITSTVGASRALPYGLAGQVGASRALPYGITAAVGASRALPYAIRVVHFTAAPPYLAVEIDFQRDPAGVGYRAAVLADSPLLYFQMAEASGATAIEITGGGTRNGSYVGTVTLQQTSPLTGQADDRAVLFDAPSEYLDATQGPVAPSRLTVECWIYNTARPASGETHDFFRNTGAGRISIKSDGTIEADFGQLLSHNPGIGVNNFIHVAVTVTGTGASAGHRLYVNGVQVAFAEGTSTLASMTSTYRWGAPGSTAATAFKGRVDEAAVYTDVLSAERVLQHYSGAPVTYPQTARWRNVTERVDRISKNRGRDSDLEPASPAGSTIGADNSDRALEPEYSGSPFYPNVRPMRRVRARAWYPANVLPDSSFERTAWGSGDSGLPWQGYNGTVREAVAGFHGGYRAKAVRASGTNEMGVVLNAPFENYSHRIPVVAGTPMTISGYLFKEPGALLPRPNFAVTFYDDAGVQVGGGSLLWGSSGVLAVPGLATLAGDVATAWTRYGFAFHVPANATHAGVFVYLIKNSLDAGAATVYGDAFQLEPGLVATPYSDTQETGVLHDYIEHFPQESPSYLRGHVTLRAVDGLAALAPPQSSDEMVQEASGTRIGKLLDKAGWEAGQRAIDAGAATIAKETLDGDSVLAHIQDVAASELGPDGLAVFFVDGAGRAVFHDANHRSTNARSTTSQGTFGDGAPATGELPYTPNLLPDYGVLGVYSEVKVIRVAQEGEANPPVEQLAADGLSRGRYWPRTLPTKTVRLTTDAAAKTYADTLLARLKEPRLEIKTITLEPARDARLWPQVLNREISDRITVKRRPQGGSVITRDYFIEAVQHEIRLTSTGVEWATTWALSLA